MAHLARSLASLRIVGDNLVPNEISTLLGSEPTHKKQLGDVITTKSGSRIAKYGLWRLNASETEPEDLDAQVVELLNKLTQDIQVWQSINKQYRIDLFCGWFMNESNEGVAISPATLQSLGERGIQLSLDIYAPSDANP